MRMFDVWAMNFRAWFEAKVPEMVNLFWIIVSGILGVMLLVSLGVLIGGAIYLVQKDKEASSNDVCA